MLKLFQGSTKLGFVLGDGKSALQGLCGANSKGVMKELTIGGFPPEFANANSLEILQGSNGVLEVFFSLPNETLQGGVFCSIYLPSWSD